MKLGDLVLHLGRHWMVSRYDAKRSRTATLLAADGTQTEIPHDLDAVGGVTVIANPSADWPFIMVPPKNGWVLGDIRHEGRVLTRFTEWVPSDPSRTGGPVFLAPNPAFRYGVTLLITYASSTKRKAPVGGTIRIDIPRDFGTVKQRAAKVAAARPQLEERNAYDRILSDDQIGDDD